MSRYGDTSPQLTKRIPYFLRHAGFKRDKIFTEKWKLNHPGQTSHFPQRWVRQSGNHVDEVTFSQFDSTHRKILRALSKNQVDDSLLLKTPHGFTTENCSIIFNSNDIYERISIQKNALTPEVK